MFKYFVVMCDIKFVLISNFFFWVVSYIYILKDYYIYGYMKYLLYKVIFIVKKLDFIRRLFEFIYIREQVYFYDDIKFFTNVWEKKIFLIMFYVVNILD